MTSLQRRINLVAVFLPFVAFVAAITLLWSHEVDATDLSIFAFFYLLVGFGITIGYHRLFTHRSFAAVRPLQIVLAILGSMAAQGPVVEWVADHRKHHAHTDEEGDPHSPHVGHGTGLRGLVHAHVGWLFRTQGLADRRQYARDMREDPAMRRISRLFALWVALGLALPALAGFVLHGYTTDGALRGLLWGGLVRVFLLHHITWSINSVCHFAGRRRFEVDDHSTNVAWLALPSLGEAWHHNHHAFPRSHRHGLGRFEPDPSALVIRGLQAVGLAHEVVVIPPERQRAKLVGQGRPEPLGEARAA
ncbi:MAG: acyl-CoA desaturase [Solirubrobacteraceae bacterium]|nr:MAG: acyl-CoA desaturase [Solirubrobacterales bacterium]